METEVLIVGAGAAGSVFAARLAEAGKSVTVLEAGRAWSTSDMISSQIWARRLKWSGPPVFSGAPPQLSHNLSFGSGLGGAALHHYGTWPRFKAETFELQSRYGFGLDWPIDYDALGPYYDRVQDEMGVAGDAAAEPWRPKGAPYPLPPLPRYRQGELLAEGFAKLDLPTAPLPVAINTVARNGREGCLFDGWCDAGCPTGALANPLVTHIPAAKAAGARFVTGETVTRIEADEKGVTSVVARDAQGAERRYEARVVILAASVVQNPRLLLASASRLHPNGLANSSGLVGAYVSIESGANVAGVFDEPTDNHFGVSAGQLLHSAGHMGRNRPPGGYQWQIAPSLKPNDIFGIAFTRPDLFGARLDAFLREDGPRLATMMGFGADAPRPQDRVFLSSDQKDAFGVPLPVVAYERAEDSVRLWRHMTDEGQAVLRGAGAKIAWAAPLIPGHVTGGTIMGRSPAASVTDSYGRTHDVPNLVLAGGGLFPANGGTSPTFTIYAVSLRAADHMLAHWSDYARS